MAWEDVVVSFVCAVVSEGSCCLGELGVGGCYYSGVSEGSDVFCGVE